MQGNGKSTPAPTAACIDAETLAAWADGGLRQTEAATVEMHLANCERCTAMLATFARTTPETAAAESLWSRWHLRWLVPIATAATVAALWVLIPQPGSAPDSTLKSEVTTQVAAAATPAPPPVEEPQRQEATDATAPSFRTRALAKPEETPAGPEQRLAERERAADEVREEAKLEVTDARPAPAAAPAAPAPAIPARAREGDRADQDLGQQRDTSAFATTGRAGAAPREPPTTGFREVARQANSARLASAAAQFQVVSPDSMTRWRVIGAGQVQRSTSGGAQWVPATLPESATLTGGSSPSPSICWLVGRTGAIYVTTDGLRFTKVPFPDRIDFVSIQALDGLRATVVTTDGRTMRTEDQGATWIRITP